MTLLNYVGIIIFFTPTFLVGMELKKNNKWLQTILTVVTVWGYVGFTWLGWALAVGQITFSN